MFGKTARQILMMKGGLYMLDSIIEKWQQTEKPITLEELIHTRELLKRDLLDLGEEV